MCKDIEKISKIKRNELDDIEYFESLIKNKYNTEKIKEEGQ